MEVNLANEELAEYLAYNLNDLEFELLVRKRIAIEFKRAFDKMPNLYEGASTCHYSHSFTDKGEWTVRIGENYSKSSTAEGEVLFRTMADAMLRMEQRLGNKLSNLLSAPHNND